MLLTIHHHKDHPIDLMKAKLSGLVALANEVVDLFSVETDLFACVG
jgi:hypothetical protein